MRGAMTVPAARLTALDLYDHVERTEESFREGDDLVEVVRDGRLRLVSTVDFRLKQLIDVIAHMRDPQYSEAMELVGKLKRARISRSVDGPHVFAQLRGVVAAWDSARLAR
jgi:hypothetical protein